MSIDQLARRAGADLRTSVLRDLDVDAAFAALAGTRRRRRRARGITAGVAVAASATAAFAAWPFSGLTVSAPDPAHPGKSYCLGTEQVTCPARDVVQVRTTVPYDVRLPEAFVGDPNVNRAPGWVEFYQRTPGVSGTRAGVTVLSGVDPARSTKHLGARQLAYWVAGRRFIAPTTVERTSVDGFPAWRVDVSLREGEPRSQSGWCESIQFECRALLRPDDGSTSWEAGPRRAVVGHYVIVDVPGPHTVAIWSWVAEGNTAAFGVNDELIGSLTFGPAR
jgi:hypothetical protein